LAGVLPEARPRIYFANHRSHGDFVLIWTVLQPALRPRTRPVAATDCSTDSIR
jgi:1-acyl-sn-glycerol-3-phosphate acyltransferase